MNVSAMTNKRKANSFMSNNKTTEPKKINLAGTLTKKRYQNLSS